MASLFAKVLFEILSGLLTKKFVSRLIAIGAWRASQWSENKVDDQMADALAEALGVDPKDYR